MGQATQPFAQQPVDLLRGQPIAQFLQYLGIGARLDAIIERLERDPALGQLALQVLMAVDAELGVVRKVRTELQKQRSEVLIDTVEVIVIDHACGFHDPRIGRPRALTAATLSAHDARLFLRLANIEHALVLLELPQVRLRDVVLSLALLKANEINAFPGHDLLDVTNEGLRHRRYCRGGGKPLAPVNPQVPQHTSHRLQVRHVDIEVHAVDRLVLKHHMIDQHVSHGSCYGHRGLRSSTGPRTHRASSSYNQGMSLQARPEPIDINRYPQLFGYGYTSSV